MRTRFKARWSSVAKIHVPWRKLKPILVRGASHFINTSPNPLIPQDLDDPFRLSRIFDWSAQNNYISLGLS